MSLWSSISNIAKPFKAIWNVTKKILPYALAAAAIVFTAGAAAGASWAIGGWAGMSGSLASTMTSILPVGIAETLTPILGNALYQAGMGAAIGGAVSGITGGNITKGVQMGALGGAVSGGITGAITGASPQGMFGFEKEGAKTLSGVSSETDTIAKTGWDTPKPDSWDTSVVNNAATSPEITTAQNAAGLGQGTSNIPNAAMTVTSGGPVQVAGGSGLGGSWTQYQGGNFPVGSVSTGGALSGSTVYQPMTVGASSQGFTASDLVAALKEKQEPFWQKAGIQALGSAGGALATAAAVKDNGYAEYAKQQQANLIANSPRPGNYGLGVNVAQQAPGKMSVYDPRTGRYYYTQAAGAV